MLCIEPSLRVRLFWVKMISGNHFHPFPHVWLSWKIIFSGKWLPIDQYFHLWPGNNFLPSFSLQSIAGQWVRVRERPCARRRSPVRRTARDRDLAIDGAISRHREIAQLIAILPSTEIAINDAISWRIDREIAPVRSRDASIERSRRRELAPLIARSRRRDRDLGSRSLMIFFLGLSFPSSFPNIRKYFPKNFLKCNQTCGNIFLFRKLAFPKNMYFPANVLRQPNTA